MSDVFWGNWNSAPDKPASCFREPGAARADYRDVTTNTTLAVITDYGGMQEETSFLGIPCFARRESTECPGTTTLGTHTLVGCDLDALRSAPAMSLTRGEPCR